MWDLDIGDFVEALFQWWIDEEGVEEVLKEYLI